MAECVVVGRGRATSCEETWLLPLCYVHLRAFPPCPHASLQTFQGHFALPDLGPIGGGAGREGRW